MMARQASTVVTTLRSSVPFMSSADNSTADLNLSSDFSKALGLNEELIDEMHREENAKEAPKTVPIGKKPPSKTILKDILENTKTKVAEPSIKSEPVVEHVKEEPLKQPASQIKRPPLSAFKTAPKVSNDCDEVTCNETFKKVQKFKENDF